MTKKSEYKELDRAEHLACHGISEDVWVLVPTPISELAGPEKREEFKGVIEKSLVQLIHTSWASVGETVRELSNTGGVELVTLYRVRRKSHAHVQFKDGKQIKQ
jgi:hypothetical protein